MKIAAQRVVLDGEVDVRSASDRAGAVQPPPACARRRLDGGDPPRERRGVEARARPELQQAGQRLRVRTAQALVDGRAAHASAPPPARQQRLGASQIAVQRRRTPARARAPAA